MKTGTTKRPHSGDATLEDTHGHKHKRTDSTKASSSSDGSHNDTTPRLLANSTLRDKTQASLPGLAAQEAPTDQGDSQATEQFDSQATEYNSQSLLETSPIRENRNDINNTTGAKEAPQLAKIKSVQADAEQISEFLGRADVQLLYERIKAKRADPERLAKVTNECLEEVEKEGEKVGTNGNNENQLNTENQSPDPGPSTTTGTDSVKSVITDISSVLKEMKKVIPAFDMDPNEVYTRLESASHLSNRVETVVKTLLEEEKERRAEKTTKKETLEGGIFEQLQQVLLMKPEADANRVFNLLEVFSDDQNCIDKVIEYLNKSENDKSEASTNSGNDTSTSTKMVKDESFKNDPLYKDMMKLAKIFTDRTEGEIYAHLEVYYDKANRIDLVMEEFLGTRSQNQSQDSLENYKLTYDSLDNEEIVQDDSANVSDGVLLKFKEDVDLLKAIFPECDPQFIIKQLQDHFEFKGRVDMVTAILMNQPNYPKIKKLSKSAEQRQRLKNLVLNIAEFLQMFPDPNETFYDEEKEMDTLYNDHSKAQLCSEFKAWKRKYIRRKLESHKYHYLPTLREIQTDMIVMGPEMEKNMADEEDEAVEKNEWPNDVSELFYRELLFAKHEEKILTYIRKKKDARLQRLEKARKTKNLLECQCCFDDEILPEDMGTCGKGHPFCKECIVRSVESALTEGKAKYPCLTGTCDEQYPLSLLQDILPNKSFSHVLRRTQEEELRQANIPDLVVCPFCPYATVMPDENDKVLRCLNPECLKESCRVCKEPNHIPQRCDEVEKSDEIKMRTFIETKMAEAMMRTCNDCQRKFYKIEGCNKMTCICGSSMCYVCREPITDYNHFNQNQKCNEAHMDKLHNNETQRAAVQAREDYLKDHPELANVELKNDPLKNMPKETLPPVVRAPRRGRRTGQTRPVRVTTPGTRRSKRIQKTKK